MANPTTSDGTPAKAVATRDAPDWELVRKRNNIEKLKAEKHPLEILHDIPDLADKIYVDIAEEDMVRFQWYGLYQDKPKTGYFMLRIKAPAGRYTAEQYKVIGQLSQKFGRNYTELTTRQTVQLHWLQIKDFLEVFEEMEKVGLTSLGGCGDAVRNITGCPVAGLDANELFDARPQLNEIVDYFLGDREYFDLPRKHKISVSTCNDQCNAPEINCIVFVGAEQKGRKGYTVRVGGGLSSTPRFARDLGVFIDPEDALPVSKAILDMWRTDLRYRMSRAKARLKFLVDDYGVDGVRAGVEEKLGRELDNLVGEPVLAAGTAHLGVHPQKDAGLNYIGFPVRLGLVTGEQTVQLGELAESYGGDVRVTRQQNFILTGVPTARLAEVIARVKEIGFDLEANGLRGNSIACTGDPLCNYAVAGTKSKLGEIIDLLETKYDKQVDGLKVGVDGCPHSCAHHWVSDIGLQGTTARGDGISSVKQEAYEIYLRGGLGATPEIGRAIIRRVPAKDAPEYVGRLVGGYLAEREGNENFQTFAKRKTDEELIALATGVPTAAAVPVEA